MKTEPKITVRTCRKCRHEYLTDETERQIDKRRLCKTCRADLSGACPMSGEIPNWRDWETCVNYDFSFTTSRKLNESERKELVQTLRSALQTFAKSKPARAHPARIEFFADLT